MSSSVMRMNGGSSLKWQKRDPTSGRDSAWSYFVGQDPMKTYFEVDSIALERIRGITGMITLLFKVRPLGNFYL